MNFFFGKVSGGWVKLRFGLTYDATSVDDFRQADGAMNLGRIFLRDARVMTSAMADLEEIRLVQYAHSRDRYSQAPRLFSRDQLQFCHR